MSAQETKDQFLNKINNQLEDMFVEPSSQSQTQSEKSLLLKIAKLETENLKLKKEKDDAKYSE